MGKTLKEILIGLSWFERAEVDAEYRKIAGKTTPFDSAEYLDFPEAVAAYKDEVRKIDESDVGDGYHFPSIPGRATDVPLGDQEPCPGTTSRYWRWLHSWLRQWSWAMRRSWRLRE